MSHAALGIEVLFGENPADAPAVTSIRDFIDDPAEDELIRASIAYHSDFRLPAQLDERTRSFCDIVRDGDKIDIMRTIADSTVDTILKVDEKTFLGSRFSSPTLAAFDEHRCVARDERDEPADFLVGLICFMFELVYPASRALAREQGDIHRLLDAPFGITRPFTDPRHAGNLEPPKGRDARLAGARLALKLGQQLLDDLDGIPNNLVLGSTENGGIRVLVDGDDALPPHRCRQDVGWRPKHRYSREARAKPIRPSGQSGGDTPANPPPRRDACNQARHPEPRRAFASTAGFFLEPMPRPTTTRRSALAIEGCCPHSSAGIEISTRALASSASDIWVIVPERP